MLAVYMRAISRTQKVPATTFPFGTFLALDRRAAPPSPCSGEGQPEEGAPRARLLSPSFPPSPCMAPSPAQRHLPLLQSKDKHKGSAALPASLEAGRPSCGAGAPLSLTPGPACAPALPAHTHRPPPPWRVATSPSDSRLLQLLPPLYASAGAAVATRPPPSR